MLLAYRENVHIWTNASGVPTRLVWGSERWRVIDEPTPRVAGLWPAWRFTVRSGQDESRTLVVDAECLKGRWSLVAAYD